MLVCVCVFVETTFRFFLQTEEGVKAEAYLKKGALAMQPDHGDGLADLAVALAMQGMDRIKEAMEMIEKAEDLGASGESFTRRRCAGGGGVVNSVLRSAWLW